MCAPPPGENDGLPVERAGYVRRVYLMGSPETTQPFPLGIAYDANTNTAYVATQENGNYYYYRVIPNNRLNTVH
jgi:hypothetical protein